MVMKKILCVCCIFLIVAVGATADAAQQHIAFGGGGRDVLLNALPPRDGTVLFVGYTNMLTSGYCSAWAVSMDEQGMIQWQLTLGGGETEDVFSAALTLPCGNVALLHERSDARGLEKQLLFVNHRGEILRAMPLPKATAFVLPGAGGFYVVGHAESAALHVGNASVGSYQPVILWMDADGLVAWEKPLGLEHQGAYESIRVTSVLAVESGILLAANLHSSETQDGTAHDGLLIKVSQSGEVAWICRTGGNDRLYAMAPAETGGVWAVGERMSGKNGESMGVALHADEQGAIQWIHTFSKSGGLSLRAAYPCEAGILVYAKTGGITDTPTPESREADPGILLLLDKQGEVQWETVSGGKCSYHPAPPGNPAGFQAPSSFPSIAYPVSTVISQEKTKVLQ